MAIRRFAIIVDGDVAGTISINEEDPSEAAHRHIAAFDSDPKIVPIHVDKPVGYGWTYNGSEFVPSTE